MVACALRFTGEAHPALFTAARHPALTAHAARCEALPAFQEIVQKLDPPKGWRFFTSPLRAGRGRRDQRAGEGGLSAIPVPRRAQSLALRDHPSPVSLRCASEPTLPLQAEAR